MAAAAAAAVLAAGFALPHAEALQFLRPAAAAAAVLLAGLAFLRPRGGRLGSLAAAAALSALARTPPPPPAATGTARPVAFTGRVIEVDAERVRLDRLDWPGAPTSARDLELTARTAAPAARGPTAPTLGARVGVEGLLENRGGRLGLVRARLAPRPGPEATAPRWSEPVLTLRSAVRDRLDAALPAESAGLARALLLGESWAAPEWQREAYRRFGLLHLLAVSGLHLWLWDRLLRFLLPGRRFGRALRLGLLGLAAVLAGARPPVLRALAAVLAHEAVELRRRRLIPTAAWAAAWAAEWSLGDPQRHGLGLVLSYAATGALLLALHRSAAGGSAPVGRSGPLRAAATGARVSLACTLGAAPWIHARWGTLEPWSVPASPVLGLLLPLRTGFSLLALAPGLAPIATCVLGAVDACERTLWRRLDSLPAAPWVRPDLPGWAVALTCALGLAALAGRRRAVRRAALVLAPLPFLLTAVPGAPLAPRASPAVAALPVGHGLGILVVGERASLLFDLGSRDRSGRALLDDVLLPTLAVHHWPAPELAVASHGDGDHVAGLAAWAQRAPDARLLLVSAGAEGDLGGRLAPWRVRVLGTRAAVRGVANLGGPVLELRCEGAAGREVRVVVLGDQEGWSLRDLARRLDPGPVDLLVLPHHGRSLDGVAELLDRLRPRRAWVSTEQPAAEVAAAAGCARRAIPLRSTAAGLLVLAPDRDGADRNAP